ncbi:hypothetical protein [Halorussus sp. MSC15.2]|nr:hypothetical protein [Halorussus sp. MSC15.2]
MGESEHSSEQKRGAVQHLNDALSAEEMDEVNYHVRQALQLLGVE